MARLIKIKNWFRAFWYYVQYKECMEWAYRLNRDEYDRMKQEMADIEAGIL